MANKKKLHLASTQANNLIAELPKRGKKIKAQVQFRNEILESQKRVNYKNEFDILQGSKRLTALQPDVKSRMKDLQQKARRSLNGEPPHAIYEAKFGLILQYIENGILPKTKNTFIIKIWKTNKCKNA